MEGALADVERAQALPDRNVVAELAYEVHGPVARKAAADPFMQGDRGVDPHDAGLRTDELDHMLVVRVELLAEVGWHDCSLSHGSIVPPCGENVSANFVQRHATGI